MGEVLTSGAGDCGFESHLCRLSDVYGGRGEFAGLNLRPKWPGLGGGGMINPHTKSLTTSFVQLPCEPIAFY